jgi:hypothetical protein
MSLETLCNVMLFRGRWIGMARHDGLHSQYVAVYVSPFEWVAPLYEGRPIKDSANLIVYERIKTAYVWNGVKRND